MFAGAEANFGAVSKPHRDAFHLAIPGESLR